MEKSLSSRGIGGRRRPAGGRGQFIREAGWRASTSPEYETMPHEYTVRGRATAGKESPPAGWHDWFVSMIRRHGYRSVFVNPNTGKSTSYWYMHYNGWKYWAIWPVINREPLQPGSKPRKPQKTVPARKPQKTAKAKRTVKPQTPAKLSPQKRTVPPVKVNVDGRIVHAKGGAQIHVQLAGAELTLCGTDPLGWRQLVEREPGGEITCAYCVEAIAAKQPV
jgi:hypothetical protein